MGVWIETKNGYDIMFENYVTPCMGVWIETYYPPPFPPFFKSHPVWVCGLKQENGRECYYAIKSHPVWVCGLKPARRSWSISLSSHTLYGCVD